MTKAESVESSTEDKPNDEPPQTVAAAKDPSKTSSWKRTSGAVLSALLVLGLTAGAGYLGRLPQFTPIAKVQTEVHAAQTVVAPAGATLLACAGPVILATETQESDGKEIFDSEFGEAPSATESSLNILSLAGSVFSADAGSDAAPVVAYAPGTVAPKPSSLAVRDAIATREPISGGGTFINADPVNEEPSAIGGTTYSRTPSGDLRGLAAVSCLRPGATQWLVGGSTTDGSSARLSLANPSKTATTVSLAIWGPSGQIALSGAGDITIPAGQERSVLLEGRADSAKRLAIRVSAIGGTVVATIQDRSLRGLTPGGVDYISPSADPGVRQEITGISIEPTAANALDPAMLRVLVPGSRDATTNIRLFGPEGEVPLQGLSPRTFTAGTVTDVSLAGLPEGNYTAVLTSDHPVTATALLVRGSQDRADDDLGTTAPRSSSVPVDRAWAPSAMPSRGAFFAVPAGPEASVNIAPADLGESTAKELLVTVQLVTNDGKLLPQHRKPLAPGKNLTLSIGALADELETERADIAGVIVTGQRDIVSSVILTEALESGADGIAIVNPTPDAQDIFSVKIQPGTNLGL